jgi:hypothetical protein
MSNNIANKKLRNELRRVMSDRVLKITKCSQQQNVEKNKSQKQIPTNLPNIENDNCFLSNELINELSSKILNNFCFNI